MVGKTKWLYGTEGIEYAVRTGDVWRAGNHVLYCGDIDDGYINKINERETYQLVYTDPPWTQGNMNSFRTKAGLQRSVYSFKAWIGRFIHSLHPRGEIWMETGKQSLDMVIDTLKLNSCAVLGIFEITYYKKHPCYLLRAIRPDFIPYFIEGSPEGLDDDDTPAWVMKRCTGEGGVIADFCMGRGLTAVTAQKLGKGSVGLELHPRRAAITLSRLYKAGAPKAELIDNVVL